MAQQLIAQERRPSARQLLAVSPPHSLISKMASLPCISTRRKIDNLAIVIPYKDLTAKQIKPETIKLNA